MRNIGFFLVLIFVLFTLTAVAEENKDVPAGMEIVEVGDIKHLVPIGTEIRKEGGVIVLEGHNEYMSRKFSDIEKRLERIENQIEQLQQSINQKGEDNLIPKEIKTQEE